jgi:hypothetical protein
MIVTCWSNGDPNLQTGSGLGIRLRIEDRDQFFDVAWTEVVIHLQDADQILVPITPSFWVDCPELRSRELGRWMLTIGIIPWLPGSRPWLSLRPLMENNFALMLL